MLLGRSGLQLLGYVNQNGNLGTVAIAWPAGTAVGDLAIFWGDNNSTGINPSTSSWTQLGTTLNCGGKLQWKILTTADLTATVSMVGSTATVNAWVFRGASVATLKGQAGNASNGGDNTLTVTGFTKNTASRGIFQMSASDATPARTVGPSLAHGIAAPASPTGAQYLAQARYTREPTDYTNGTSFTLNLNTSTWSQDDLLVVEFT